MFNFDTVGEFSHNDCQLGPVLVRKSESGIVRLIRTACKALSKHGSEQSGMYQPFTTFLRSNGVARNPLATFRGNRFNILFYDAGTLFHIAPLVQKFFIEVWQTPNQLLKAVLADIKIPEHLAGCKALGLVNKFITGPLWRVLESRNITILEMNERFQNLLTSLNSWSLDASSILSGEALLYDEILQVLCSAFSSLLSRLVKDHLSGGQHDNPSENLLAETKSVPKTNTISERDFAKLD